jgi:putative Mg2+ transporter-C (MgtC) family protein
MLAVGASRAQSCGISSVWDFVDLELGGLMSALLEFSGQGRLQLEELFLAFVLSALVGLEREIRQKSAGLRTYTLVGVSAALFMLISKYGFMDVLQNDRVIVDPSRVAAQIVSGIGFIGGGVIFMRRDVVRGLTTAASVWLTAALGMACGAGLPILAVATTVGHIIIMLVFPRLVRYLPRERRARTTLRISYQERPDLLRSILVACTQLRFAIDNVEVERGTGSAADREAMLDLADLEGTDLERPLRDVVERRMQVRGKRPISNLIARLAEIQRVVRVGSVDEDGGIE